MQSARDLLYAYVEALNNHDPAAAAALYADDGTLDFPFAASVGRALAPRPAQGVVTRKLLR